MQEVKESTAETAPSASAPAVRILDRLDLPTGSTGRGDGRGPYVGIAVAIGTTGLDPETDVIVELALRRFRYGDAGMVTDIDRSYVWLEDPASPLSKEVRTLTGLEDAEVIGQSIDEEAATRLLRSASFVVGHHSRFDRRWIERRLPEARGLNWSSSLEQIDWRGHGFEGKALGFLLAQSGYFHVGCRAAADVDALIQLLRNEFDDGRTALRELIDRASKPSWIIRADGANIAVKELLGFRGYRWDVGRKVWWREVADEDRTSEEFWLAGHVYDMAANPKAMGPSFERIRANTRFL